MVASLVIAAILLVEHRLISEDDMSRVNLAFFTLNGIISVLLFFAVALDLALYA
jgi:4-hydroxybenzoate polyprenyltransferase